MEGQASKRRRQAEARLEKLQRAAQERVARGENALGHTAAAQQEMALAVLLQARSLVCRAYNKQAGEVVSSGRRELLAQLGDAHSVVTALQEAGQGGIQYHYATRVLTRVLHEPVATWERHPLVDQDAALRVLDAAVVLAGGTAPRERPRKPRVHRGGWSLSYRSAGKEVAHG